MRQAAHPMPCFHWRPLRWCACRVEDRPMSPCCRKHHPPEGAAMIARPLAILLVGFALLVAGCAGFDYGASSGPPVAAPAVKVGDRWVYRGREGFRVPVLWEETHEVTRVDAAGITVRVT